MSSNPNYDPAQLKRSLPEVQRLNFEIHEDHVVMQVTARTNNLVALIRMGAMPKDTTELVHVVRCAFFLHQHKACTGFTMTRDNRKTYTRQNDVETYKRIDALAQFEMGGNAAEDQLFAEVRSAGGDVLLPATQLDAKLANLEWGTKGDAKRLRQDVVKKTLGVFGQF